MLKKNNIIKGTFILTLSSAIGRVIGFFYRIFLSRAIGAESLGIYQLVFPIYALAYSITVSGIQTAISRLVSARCACSDKKGANLALICGLIFSVSLSIIVSGLLFLFHEPLSLYYIKESRTSELLKIIALAIPFGSFHACIDGYYYGLKNTAIPAIRSLCEQLFRFLLLLLIYYKILGERFTLTPGLAVSIIVIQELFSAVFSAAAICIHIKKDKLPFRFKLSVLKDSRDLLSIAVPLTSNRVLVSVLQSLEALLIPLCLRYYGLDTTASLSLYGILTGMALPLIFFPTTFTFSLSTVLLPSISEAQIRNKTGRIRQLIQRTSLFCFLLGFTFWFLFFFFGNSLCTLLFHNNLAGHYVRSLSWICPLFYLTPALFSILNGLGETTSVLLFNLSGILIRILCLVILVPLWGINGYFAGLLMNQLMIFLLIFRKLRHLFSPAT